MTRKKISDEALAAINPIDIGAAAGPRRVAKIVRHYRKTGAFRRRDLRLVLGSPSAGVSAGPEGLQELFALRKASGR